jgi:hypothetical protein
MVVWKNITAFIVRIKYQISIQEGRKERKKMRRREDQLRDQQAKRGDS